MGPRFWPQSLATFPAFVRADGMGITNFPCSRSVWVWIQYSRAEIADDGSMRSSSHNPTRSRRQLLRVLAVVGGLVAFVGIATLVNPTSSLAKAVRNASGFALANGKAGSTVTTADGADTRASLGSLVGPEFRVSIFAASDHATYSVTNAAGQAVAVDVSGEDVYKSVPELDVRSLMADVEVDSAY